MFHEAQPEEDDGDGEQSQTDGVQQDGRLQHVGHVGAEGGRQQGVDQPIEDVPERAGRKGA